MLSSLLAIACCLCVELVTSRAPIDGANPHGRHIVADPTTAGNMNQNVRYIVANPLPGHEDQIQNFTGEFFEVYSPAIKSRYSEVFWKSLPAVPIPEDIRTRFQGSIMAITGFEVDVVRKTTAGDVSVPCYESYNHHYGSTIVGAKATLSDVPGPDHGHGPTMLFDAEDGPAWIPQVQVFNEHNGNEARQSFHGLPKGYVQPIESPTSFIMSPMQINTRNPDGSGTRGGPLPRSSRAPPNASYSGLMECPCSTRRKKVIGGPVSRSHGVCGDSKAPSANPWDPVDVHVAPSDWPVETAEQCFATAAALLGRPASKNATVSNASLPPRCSVVPSEDSALSYEAIFNDLTTSSTQCGRPGIAHSVGHQESLVTLDLDVDEASASVTITMKGGDGKWFGVGFGASKMADAPYTIVVDGFGNVTERKLGDHVAGKVLATTVKVVSNNVQAGKRTVVLSRALRGVTADHFTFAANQSSIPFINALGGAPNFGQHVAREPSTISLLELGVGTCVCRLKGGTIDGFNFDPECPPWPLSDVATNKNPTCDVSTYVGGLACCRGGNFLLDADQEIPDYVDEVYYKWRFYFEDWNPARQVQAVHLEWALNGCDSGGGHMGCHTIEFDIPQAPAGTPVEEAVHNVTSHFTVNDMLTPCDARTQSYCADPKNVTSAGIQLIMAGGHCHSPACLSIELWNEDTGESLCRITPRMGDGNEAHDEKGYLWLPHCAWGEAKDGLRPPPILHPETKLRSLKRGNSTYGHYGVMAIWQMRGAFALAPSVFV